MAATRSRKRTPEPPAPEPIYADVISVEYVTRIGLTRGTVTEIGIAVDGKIVGMHTGDQIAFLLVDK